MKKKILILALALLIITGIGLFIFKNADKKEQEAKAKPFGRVNVMVTPKQISPAKSVILDLSLSNHAIELDYDFSKTIKLTDNLGNTYEPISWNGGSGGHHINGEISFNPLKKGVKNIALKLEGIDGITDTFEFDVN